MFVSTSELIHSVGFLCSGELADNDPPPTPNELSGTSWPAPGIPKPQQSHMNSSSGHLSTSSTSRYNNNNAPSPASALSMNSLYRRQHQPTASVDDSGLSPQQARVSTPDFNEQRFDA